MTKYRCVEVMEFSTAADFLECLDPNNPVWGTGLDLGWIFRGHGDASWLLQPWAWRPDGQSILKPLIKMYRSSNPIETLRTRGAINDDSKVKEVVESFVQTAAEAEAVRRFVELADELGLAVPNPNPLNKPALLAGKLDYFEPDETYGFAQHHRIPTRLLDWTRKPRYAAFFAAENASRIAAASLAVWAMRLDARRHCPALRILTCSRSQHSFLHAQDGLFLWHANAHSFYVDHARWPAFDELLERAYEQVEDEPPLRKLVLPTLQADSLLLKLWRERISRAHLMPAFDNVTQAVRSQWKIESPFG